MRILLQQDDIQSFTFLFTPETPIATAAIAPGCIKKSDVVHIRDFQCTYGHKNVPDGYETAVQFGVELMGAMEFCQRCWVAKAPSQAVSPTTPTDEKLPF